MDKRTPLYDVQKAVGAKFISFGGWELPVSYTDILHEHQTVRERCGLFDVSHMGEILITGKDALKFVNKLVTNDIASPPFGKAVYSPMCYDGGTVVDDILVYKFSDTCILLVVNASNAEKDEEWIKSLAEGEIAIENVSQSYVQLALQGPLAEKIMEGIVNDSLPAFFAFKETVLFGMRVLLSRTGYTGEDGFEIYLNLKDTGANPANPAEPAEPADPEKLWKGLLEAGKEYGLEPIGLGARDTLRLEAALPLYGHELSDSITPLEAGLDRFVKLQKEAFIGKEALAKRPPERRLYGFEMLERGIPRNGYEVRHKNSFLGYVTSGGPLPSLNRNGGLALLGNMELADGEELEIIIRDRAVKAKIVSLPFYGKKYKK